jgi:prolyl-tRNA synthetase
VKFKDAELIGVPTIVVAGRGVATGTFELRDRITGTTSEISIAEAADTVIALRHQQ